MVLMLEPFDAVAWPLAMIAAWVIVEWLEHVEFFR